MDATTRLDEIAVFVHVVKAGSFTAAAEQRGVPKSTLSRAVTRLEEAMHAPLLRRTARRIGLTDAGRALFDRAAPHIAGLEDAAESALGDEDQPQGTLRLTAPVDTGEGFLADLLVRFTARYPLLRVDVDLSSRKVNLVEEGLDVALRASGRLDDNSLVARRVASGEAHVFGSPSYLARRGTPNVPEDLASHDCVLFRPVDGANEWKLVSSAGERTVRVTGRLGSSDFSFVKSAVRAGAGLASMPAFIAAREVGEGHLVRVLPSWSRTSGVLYIVYPASPHVPKKVTVFRDFVLESFAQGLWRF
jgi:DNA-binding transcriptional LysR family regulator